MPTEHKFRKIGKYEIQSELGRGGFGRVYKAYDPDVKRFVAIKILVSAPEHDLLARFRFEAAAAGSLRHKNIVTIHEFGEHQQQPFLVMEYLEGQTLQALIASRQPLPILQKMAIMSQVAEGLQYAHANGVVHRDVKPANIMVLTDGTVKIMDFGIARATSKDAARLTETGFLVGTLRYMAPEQFENSDAGVLGDIFACGVVYYEFLTGKHPFEAPDAASLMFKITRADPPPVRQSVPDCPDALERIIGRALAKDRSLRYQSMEELQFDAEPLAVGLRRKRAEELLQEANSRAAGNQPESAVALVRELLDLDPSNHEALLLRSSLQQQVHQRVVKARIDALLKEETIWPPNPSCQTRSKCLSRSCGWTRKIQKRNGHLIGRERCNNRGNGRPSWLPRPRRRGGPTTWRGLFAKPRKRSNSTAKAPRPEAWWKRFARKWSGGRTRAGEERNWRRPKAF
jgi:serine/threonine-protein kinase